MNNQNISKKENIGHFCTTRITRKRLSTNNSASAANWKLTKVNSSSSPLSSFEDIGVGMLDSEGSSSSIPDIAKMHNVYYDYGQQQSLHKTNIDDNSNHICQSEKHPNINHKAEVELQKIADNSSALSLLNTHQQKQPTVSSLPLELRDGTLTSNNIRIEKVIRSPLSTVESNIMLNSMNSQNVQANSKELSLSPQVLLSLPSTSQQAKLLRQQQKIKLQNLSKQYHCFIPPEDFFLYRTQSNVENNNVDGFSMLSDEMILHIFKWLPKKALLRCGMVCHRFSRCASDESLWTRLDLAGIRVKSGALENIFKRGVIILRLAQAELIHPVFEERFLHDEPSYESKVQYLDLSMVTIKKQSLKMLLSRCRQLKKLSLEHVPLNDDICAEISQNTNLETLNLAMCSGLEAWNVRKMLTPLEFLTSLNISWTNLSVDAVTSLVTTLTPNILRLNLAGCRKTMFDSHLMRLAKRCKQLLELDLSDCTALTGNAILIICTFKELEYLSLSRCYAIGASTYIELENMPSLNYLDIFGMLTESSLEVLRDTFTKIKLNQFIHSSVARPTVGTRRTSIWGLRTRDFHI